MKFDAGQIDCLSHEISAYIDGELDAAGEASVERHLSSCSDCLAELNSQKVFLRDLEHSLKFENEIDLPADFAKKIVANAESTVSGLRRPRERFNAIFICAGLLLFALFALGADAGRVFRGASTVLDQTAAVADFFSRIAYSFVLGTSVILRSLASHFRLDIAVTVMFFAGFSIILFLFSRTITRFRRA